MAVVSITTFSAFIVPEIRDASAPVIDIEDDQVLIIFDIDLFAIDFHGEET